MLVLTKTRYGIWLLFFVFVHPAQTNRFAFVETIVLGNFAFILCVFIKLMAAQQKYFKKGDF
jgi:hypothetical protein